jgi:hypothetical protein
MQVTDYGVVHEKLRSAASEYISPSLWGLVVHFNVLIWAGNVSMSSERCISVLSTHLCPTRASGLFSDGCPTWSRISLRHIPHMCHPRVDHSIFLMGSTHHFAPHAVLSSFVLLPHIDASIYLDAPFGILSQWACCYVRDQILYSHQTSRKLYFCVF